jgi:hypothetical protein
MHVDHEVLDHGIKEDEQTCLYRLLPSRYRYFHHQICLQIVASQGNQLCWDIMWRLY